MKHRIVFDPELMRPGCVLLQVALGGEREMAFHFDATTWLVAPTPGMGTFEVTEEQLKLLVAKVENAHARKQEPKEAPRSEAPKTRRASSKAARHR